MFRLLRPAVLSLLLIGSLAVGVAGATPLVELQAVLGQRAMLLVDGTQRMLRVGETSPEGVRLLAVSAGAARVQADGQSFEVPLGGRAGGVLEAGRAPAVWIHRDDAGMYQVAGTINGRSVQFLVDTGATTVAMNDATARGLGIDYRAGERRLVETASGIVEAFAVELTEVAVGSIRVPNVGAMVIRGAQPSRVLLGRSFLSRTQIEHVQDALVLRRKY
jgi:aspartyl protease family protein